MNYHFSKRIQRIQPSPTVAITTKAKQMKAEGIDVIGFGAVNPILTHPNTSKKRLSRHYATAKPNILLPMEFQSSNKPLSKNVNVTSQYTMSLTKLSSPVGGNTHSII